MAGKSRAQKRQEEEEAWEAFKWWVWVLSDKQHVADLTSDIKRLGDLYAQSLRILSGTEHQGGDTGWPKILDKGPR